MKNKNKKFVQATVAIIVAIGFISLESTTIAYKGNLKLSNNSIKEVETAKIICQIEGKQVVKELPLKIIDKVIELAKSCKNDFYIIYNKWESDKEVDIAFSNIQPFFTVLIENELTDMSSEELNEMFRDIRIRIGKPRRDPSSLYKNLGGEVQPNLYIWNGIPTPIACNVMCGLYTIGTSVIGYSLGTHTILPGPGIDLWNTWFMSAGNGGSIGLVGATLVAVSEFAMTLGFTGVLLGVWPTGIITPFIFQTGLCMLYIGVSIV